MLRTAAQLVFVLAHVAPGFQPRAEAAVVFAELGRRYSVDPLLLIADVEHESRWKTQVINQHSGAVGLMQIMPEGHGCEVGPDPVDYCLEVREALRDWRHNLRVGAADFAAARAYCVVRHRGALARNWLQLPTGWDAVRGSRCGYRNGKQLPIPKQVIALLARRAQLERLLNTQKGTDGQGKVDDEKRHAHGGARHHGGR